MVAMLRDTNGVAFRVVSPTAIELVHGEPPSDERRELINLSSAQVRACFEGPPLARAHAVAALSPGAFAKLFGAQGDPDNHYKSGWDLRRIGRRLRDPIVCASLANEPLRFLRAAAKEREPAAQLQAAVRARAMEAAARKGRGAK